MENNYRLCESEQSCKQKCVRRTGMLIVLGLFIWQISNGSLGEVDFVVSVLGADTYIGVSELFQPESAVLLGWNNSAP